MKERRIYWRWKGKQYVLTGRLPNKKEITLWTLPNANTIIKMLKDNETFFKPEKKVEMLEKYERLEYKADRKPKGFSKVQLMADVRNKSDVSLEEPTKAEILQSIKECGINEKEL